MILVHGDRAEAALPEMAGALAPGVNDPGIAAMYRSKRPAQPVAVARRQDEMHVIGHQAPGPHFDIGRAAALGQQIAVERKSAVSKSGNRFCVRPRSTVYK